MIIFIIIFFIVLLTGSQSVYIVDETNHAVVTQFGKITATNSTPGLKIKTPFIQNVTYLEKRILTLDTPSQEFLTSDEKRILVDQITRWKISAPKEFFLSVRTESGGEARLLPIVQAELRAQIASELYSTMISAKRDLIMTTVLAGVSERLLANKIGIKVIDIRTKRADLPQTVEQSVFNRMESARRIEADRYRADGQQKANIITSETDRSVKVMLACADRVAKQVVGRGDASAIAIFAEALGQDPGFYSVTKRLEAYQTTIGSGNDRLILSTDSNFLSMLNGDLNPQDSIPLTTGTIKPLSASLTNPYDEEATNNLIIKCLPE
jgi:membrane protease subunit HflC